MNKIVQVIEDLGKLFKKMNSSKTDNGDYIRTVYYKVESIYEVISFYEELILDYADVIKECIKKLCLIKGIEDYYIDTDSYFKGEKNE